MRTRETDMPCESSMALFSEIPRTHMSGSNSDDFRAFHPQDTTLTFHSGAYKAVLKRTPGQVDAHRIRVVVSSIAYSGMILGLFSPSQWEMALLCTDVSHWFCANLVSTLIAYYKKIHGLNSGSHWMEVIWRVPPPLTTEHGCRQRSQWLACCSCSHRDFYWQELSLHSFLLDDDVIKWKHFLRYWPFVLGIHWFPMNSPHRGQWRRALVFSLICVWIYG